jgi:hypothetical protein
MDRGEIDKPLGRLTTCILLSNSHACPIMIGPAPMMRMDWMSVRLGISFGASLFHQEALLQHCLRPAQRTNGPLL